ncbi:MAG TPA: glycosyltransferase family 4 protein [Candidatus Angelobacter sp.]|nr:glycosyltransferase family 4 protein [Candidatus Angelobacter sp.]
MKLLIYSHYFAPSIGGVETIVMSLARGLAELRAENGAREFEITLVTQTPRGDFEDSALPFPVVRQPGFWQLMHVVRGADVVHLAGPALAPLALGLLRRRPVVIEHHGFQVICPTGQLLIESRGEPCPGHFMAGRRGECWKCDPALGWFASRRLWLLTFVRRFLSKRAAANIMPTKWLGEQLDLPRATTIHHGLIQISPARKTEPQSSRAPVIAFQGRLVSTKGARVLLDAAKILCEQGAQFELVVIGDGPERAKLEAVAAQAPLVGRVRFTGKLASAELEKELARASVVVVPSLGGEVFGLVVAENMLRGIPVIASALGSFLEVVGEDGITFRVSDAGELACKLGELLQLPSQIQKLGEAGRQRIETRFSLQAMIEKHREAYRRL